MPTDGDPCEVPSRFLQVCQRFEAEAAFEAFFKERTGFALRKLQKMWAMRALGGISFALLAPTGIGKTTFGLTYAAFLRPKKSYLIFPTRLLAKQAYERLLTYGGEALFYDARCKNRDEVKKRIFTGEFEILITTTSFLYKNFEQIPKEFDFVFVDDVDSVLKSARNIDKLLQVLGFDAQDIATAMEMIDLKIEAARGKFDEKRFERLQKELEKVRQKPHATLIVSSATAAPKGKRIKLFRELLGFEVGRPSIAIRNVEDLFENIYEDIYEKSAAKIGEFGKGGLVFLSGHRTKEDLHTFLDFLHKKGIAAQSYEEFDEAAFRSGEVEVVVGFASYRNPLARGIDLPDVVRYALFVEVPRLEFRLDLTSATSLYTFLKALSPFLQESFEDALRYLERVRYIPQERLTQKAKERIAAIAERLEALLTPQLIEELNENPDIFIKKEDAFKLIVADVTGYIQASGRTSRLWVGGVTKGLAYTLVDDEKAFKSLQRRAKWYGDIEFKNAKDVEIAKILEEIDRDREELKEVLAGKSSVQKDLLSTALVVVESPNKARTIASFYGKPLVRQSANLRIYEVAKEDSVIAIAASKGHLFDLSTGDGFHGVLEEEPFREVFEPIDESRQIIIEALRELDVEVAEVYVATDPDTEGEKISYDIFLNSLLFNSNIKRAEFHEVTKRAFDEALKNPRQFDEDLVKAQLVRRVADRWIGFEISHYLQERFGRKTLSAGRVQTAVLEWIVLREYEAKEEVFEVEVQFDDERVGFVFEDEQEARSFYNDLQKIELSVVKKEPKKLFKTPFSTDAMLFAASSELHFSPQKSMSLAQELFEAGFITYHRTDSVRVSSAGINVAKEYILDHFGKEYFVPRTHAKAGGAHECIRPTRAMDSAQLRSFAPELSSDHIKLYDLIFRIFIASQMKEAVVEEVEAKVKALDKEAIVHFYDKILEHGIDLIVEVPLKELKEGAYEVEKDLKKRPKVPRYSYAQIIKMMKERGIGRPSTYAITLQKLQQRRYIYQRGGVLFATKLGIEVYEEIKRHEKMYAFVNENYTRELEAIMDKVAAGELDYQAELAKLYERIKKELYEDTL